MGEQFPIVGRPPRIEGVVGYLKVAAKRPKFGTLGAPVHLRLSWDAGGAVVGYGHQEVAPMDAWMKPALSLAVVAVSFFIILKRRDDRNARDWAFGVIGLILGYWLK